MNNIKATTVILFTAILFSLSAQESRYDIPSILPGEYTIISNTTSTYTPEDRMVRSTDTHEFVFLGQQAISDTATANLKETKERKMAVIEPTETEKIIASFRSKKLRNALMEMTESPNFKKMVLDIDQKSKKNISYEKVAKKYGWISNI